MQKIVIHTRKNSQLLAYSPKPKPLDQGLCTQTPSQDVYTQYFVIAPQTQGVW